MDGGACCSSNGNTKRVALNNRNKQSGIVEREVSLLKEFQYNSVNRTTDNTDVAAVAVILKNLYDLLYQQSESFQLHVKSYSQRNRTSGCVTICEFLTDYLIKDKKFICRENYSVIYNWLTSFADTLSYVQTKEETGVDETAESSKVVDSQKEEYTSSSSSESEDDEEDSGSSSNGDEQ